MDRDEGRLVKALQAQRTFCRRVAGDESLALMGGLAGALWVTACVENSLSLRKN